MGLLPLMKKLGFIFLLVSASAFALSSAGRPSILIYNSQDDNHQEVVERRIHEHERILRNMNSRDYGNFSPTPKLVRPPFKLIPN